MNLDAVECKGWTSWNIFIRFVLSSYNKQGNEWQNTLKTECLEGFVETILFEMDDYIWNDLWCASIEDMEIDENMAINIVFAVNEHLFVDYFEEYFNVTSFSEHFIEYTGINIGEWSMNISSSMNRVQTEGVGAERGDIIMVGMIIFVFCCCGISIYAVRLCWKHDQKYYHDEFLHAGSSSNLSINKTKTNSNSNTNNVSTKITITTPESENNDDTNHKNENGQSQQIGPSPSARTKEVAIHIAAEMEMATKTLQIQSVPTMSEETLNQETDSKRLRNLESSKEEKELEAIYKEMMEEQNGNKNNNIIYKK